MDYETNLLILVMLNLTKMKKKLNSSVEVSIVKLLPAKLSHLSCLELPSALGIKLNNALLPKSNFGQ
jgi:hypothetical protein